MWWAWFTRSADLPVWIGQRAAVAEQLQQVVAGADQGPFALHLLQSPQQELPEYSTLLDLTEPSASACSAAARASASSAARASRILSNRPSRKANSYGNSSPRLSFPYRRSSSSSTSCASRSDSSTSPRSCFSFRHWPPDGDRRRNFGCDRGRCLVASVGCSALQGGFICQKPLSPKPGALFHPPTTAPHSSFRWIGV